MTLSRGRAALDASHNSLASGVEMSAVPAGLYAAQSLAGSENPYLSSEWSIRKASPLKADVDGRMNPHPTLTSAERDHIQSEIHALKAKVLSKQVLAKNLHAVVQGYSCKIVTNCECAACFVLDTARNRAPA